MAYEALQAAGGEHQAKSQGGGGEGPAAQHHTKMACWAPAGGRWLQTAVEGYAWLQDPTSELGAAHSSTWLAGKVASKCRGKEGSLARMAMHGRTPVTCLPGTCAAHSAVCAVELSRKHRQVGLLQAPWSTAGNTERWPPEVVVVHVVRDDVQAEDGGQWPAPCGAVRTSASHACALHVASGALQQLCTGNRPLGRHAWANIMADGHP